MLGNPENFHEFKDFVTIKTFFEYFYLIIPLPTTLEASQASKMASSAKIVNGFQSLIIFPTRLHYRCFTEF